MSKSGEKRIRERGAEQTVFHHSFLGVEISGVNDMWFLVVAESFHVGLHCAQVLFVNVSLSLHLQLVGYIFPLHVGLEHVHFAVFLRLESRFLGGKEEVEIKLVWCVFFSFVVEFSADGPLCPSRLRHVGPVRTARFCFIVCKFLK